MRFEQHFPGNIDQDKSKDRFASLQLLQCLLSSLLGCILTGDAASHQKICIHAIAHRRVHAKTTICFHTNGGADDELLSLLYTQRVKPRQMSQWRKRPFPGRIAKGLSVRFRGGTTIQRAAPETTRARHAELTANRIPSMS